jgi:hypothetical protein
MVLPELSGDIYRIHCWDWKEIEGMGEARDNGDLTKHKKEKAPDCWEIWKIRNGVSAIAARLEYEGGG